MSAISCFVFIWADFKFSILCREDEFSFFSFENCLALQLIKSFCGSVFLFSFVLVFVFVFVEACIFLCAKLLRPILVDRVKSFWSVCKI